MTVYQKPDPSRFDWAPSPAIFDYLILSSLVEKIIGALESM
jgi:hypothetical protein